ncbi:SacI homology domain-containing protein [Tirmania nivea]|nr:SacI homology domain-containing protein [Tirmania nivea]
MSSPARRILIVAAVEGLLLMPIPANNNSSTGNTPPKSRRSTPAPSRAASPSSAQLGAVHIDYKDANIRKLLVTKSDEHRRKAREGGLEVHGIAGVLNVSATVNYLIAITSRQQVAIVNGVPVYVVTDVALIALSSQSSAQEAIAKAKASRARHTSDDEDETDSSDDESEATEGEDHKDAPSIAARGVGSARSSTESDRPDTVGSRGVYGLFAQKWFSKSGWTAARPKGGQGGKSVEGPKTSMEVTDDEPGNQDVTPTPRPAPGERRQSTDLREGIVPPPSPRPENKPALELESFPALPLSEEERAEQLKIAEQVKEDAVHSLTPKLLHTTRLLLGASKSFFFSYDMDITRPFSQQQQQAQAAGDTPLWTNVDPLYFWNKHLLRPFMSSNQHSLILPLMQGFVGQKTFYAPVPPPEAGDASEAPLQKQPFVLTLISRRSTKRAGLRYLRRGVDSEGNVANCVETEQLLAIPALPSEPKSSQTPSPGEVPPDQLPWAKVYSFMQIRGSIPVYFQQSPYALRPKPVLLHSENSNKAAFEKHFINLENRYNGEIFGISLVERSSAEKIVGEKYEKYIGELNKKREEAGPGSRKVGFNWFDFHKVCRGMRFEKVSLLLDEIDGTLNNLGWTEVMEGKIGGEGKELKSVQRGIVRTNCMDCLDRTNVVQSACGRRALERQLEKEGVDLSQDPTDWFNLVWADNGDAISKQYASTAALKGDFTRTRKRNYRGALADLGLTINRYFTNIISDFFTQAAIDYLLGNVNHRVFDEYEAEMMSKDPAYEAGMWDCGGDKVGGIRANAIDISSKIVIADSEDMDDFDTQTSGKDTDKEVLIKGWTFLTPHEENTIRTFPFEETVLLLTNKALYNCRFDFVLEKVSSFGRVDLRSVRELQVGTYITSTLTPAATDEDANAGFVVKFVTGGEVRRVNTRTVRSRVNSKGEGEPGGEESTVSVSSDTESLTIPDGPVRIIAFKALPRTSAVRHDGKPKDQGAAHAAAKDKDENLDIPAKEQMREVCLRIERAVLEALPDRGAYLASRRLRRRAEEASAAGVVPAAGEVGRGKEPQEMMGVLINEEDIIGLREAKMKTGLLERWGYQVRRLVWA